MKKLRTLLSKKYKKSEITNTDIAPIQNNTNLVNTPFGNVPIINTINKSIKSEDIDESLNGKYKLGSFSINGSVFEISDIKLDQSTLEILIKCHGQGPLTTKVNDIVYIRNSYGKLIYKGAWLCEIIIAPCDSLSIEYKLHDLTSKNL